MSHLRYRVCDRCARAAIRTRPSPDGLPGEARRGSRTSLRSRPSITAWDASRKTPGPLRRPVGKKPPPGRKPALDDSLDDNLVADGEPSIALGSVRTLIREP